MDRFTRRSFSEGGFFIYNQTRGAKAGFSFTTKHAVRRRVFHFQPNTRCEGGFFIFNQPQRRRIFPYFHPNEVAM